MRLVMIFEESDGCTYSCTTTLPIEYESAEAAILDFENLCKKQFELQDWRNDTFEFAGRKFWASLFYEREVGTSRRHSYNSPKFMTIDEWFEYEGWNLV